MTMNLNMGIKNGGGEKCPLSIYLTTKITQIKQNLTSPRQNIFLPKVKRVFLPASITLEAALVIPIFIFSFIIMAYTLMILNFQARVNQSLYNTSRTLARYSYVYDSSEAADIMAAGAMVISEIGADNIKQIGVVGGAAGFNFLFSDFEDGIADIVVNYTIKFPFDIMGNFYINCTQRARTRAFIGVNPCGEEGNADEKYVYVTVNGKVYHKNIDCTYLKLSIKSIEYSSLEQVRNKNGGKYYECEYCKQNNAPKQVFITDYGNRYHFSINCQGLKRGILKIQLNKAGEYRPCSKCGG